MGAAFSDTKNLDEEVLECKEKASHAPLSKCMRLIGKPIPSMHQGKTRHASPPSEDPQHVSPTSGKLQHARIASKTLQHASPASKQQDSPAGETRASPAGKQHATAEAAHVQSSTCGQAAAHSKFCLKLGSHRDAHPEHHLHCNSLAGRLTSLLADGCSTPAAAQIDEQETLAKLGDVESHQDILAESHMSTQPAPSFEPPVTPTSATQLQLRSSRFKTPTESASGLAPKKRVTIADNEISSVSTQDSPYQLEEYFGERDSLSGSQEATISAEAILNFRQQISPYPLVQGSMYGDRMSENRDVMRVSNCPLWEEERQQEHERESSEQIACPNLLQVLITEQMFEMATLRSANQLLIEEVSELQRDRDRLQNLLHRYWSIVTEVRISDRIVAEDETNKIKANAVSKNSVKADVPARAESCTAPSTENVSININNPVTRRVNGVMINTLIVRARKEHGERITRLMRENPPGDFWKNVLKKDKELWDLPVLKVSCLYDTGWYLPEDSRKMPYRAIDHQKPPSRIYKCEYAAKEQVELVTTHSLSATVQGCKKFLAIHDKKFPCVVHAKTYLEDKRDASPRRLS